MACQDGYFGSSCNPCPPGFYGAECAGRCLPDCAEKDCNHIIGCQNDTKITTQKTKSAVSTMTKTSQLMFTNTVSIPTNTSSVFVTKEPTREGEINGKYILVGGGIILGMLLFLIAVQLYTRKTSKSAKKNKSKYKKCEDIRSTDESAVDAQVGIKHGSEMKHLPKNENNYNQHAESSGSNPE